MGATTEIAWTHSTFNPWWGCQRVSPGCEHCYAESFSKRVGLKVWGPTTDRRFFGEKHWAEPLKWNAAAEKSGERRRVFCASMADVFEDRRDLDGWRQRLWIRISQTPWLDWLLLTKRPENLRGMYPWFDSGAPNVWLGVTGEDQEYLNRRWEHLRQAKAVVRFVSHEPALGPVRLPTNAGLHWLITGGESGHGSRIYNLDWARSLVAECEHAGVACFVKQLGASAFDGAERVKFKDAKGGDWDEWPLELRVRQFPEVRQ